MGTPLSAPARLGLQLGLAALLLVLSSALFGLVAHDLTGSQRLLPLDLTVAQWLHRRASPEFTRLLLLFTHLHGAGAMALYGLAAVAWLVQRGRRRHALTVTLALGGVLILNVLMKLAFQRARPSFDEPLLTLATYSFPSGHVAASTVAYGLLVAAVFAATRRLLPRALILLGALLAVSLVAFTRLYLGVHYLSDVIAAFAEGVAWLITCLAAVQAYEARRRRRALQGGRQTASEGQRA